MDPLFLKNDWLYFVTVGISIIVDQNFHFPSLVECHFPQKAELTLFHKKKKKQQEFMQNLSISQHALEKVWSYVQCRTS